VTEIIEQARKGGLMNVKENYYIYEFERRKALIEEQQKNKKENNQSSLFETVIETDKDKNKNDAGYGRL
jgi:hypothetical protein